VTGLPEAEDLGVGEDAQVELGDGEALREWHPRHDERARRRRVFYRLARYRLDIPVGEKLGEAGRLRGRDEARSTA